MPPLLPQRVLYSPRGQQKCLGSLQALCLHSAGLKVICAKDLCFKTFPLDSLSSLLKCLSAASSKVISCSENFP